MGRRGRENVRGGADLSSSGGVESVEAKPCCFSGSLILLEGREEEGGRAEEGGRDPRED